MRPFVIVAIILSAISSLDATKDEPNPENAVRISEEADIREAVFRYEFIHNSSIQGRGAAVYCLSVEGNSDPPDVFMKRFAGFKPPVRKISECSTDPYKGVIDKRTGKHGLIFRVRSIKWISDIEVEVLGGYFEDGLSASGNTYTVRKKQKKWKVSNAVMSWLS
jgi:hypothetical protein